MVLKILFSKSDMYKLLKIGPRTDLIDTLSECKYYQDGHEMELQKCMLGVVSEVY